MPKYILKNKKRTLSTTKPIYYKNGHWIADGKRIGNWTLSQLQFKDSDGYYKTPLPNGTLAVQDVDKNGNPIKTNYIGGNKQEVRNKYWEQAPIMNHVIDSISNIYNLNPNVLKHRLNEEGFTDNAIAEHNKNVKNKTNNRNSSNYSKLHQINSLDFSDEHTQDLYGLDDGFYYIERGDVVPTKETNYNDHYFTNKFGRKTHAVHGKTVNDNFNLTAATLKFMRDKASKDFPNASRIFLDEAAGIYYNRGITGGKKYMKNKKK